MAIARISMHSTVTLLSTHRYLSLLGGTNIRHDGSYAYSRELIVLEAAAQNSQMTSVPAVPISGFLPMQEWFPYLQMHPDRDFAEFMKRGLTSRFRIRFNPAHPLHTAPANFRSVQDHPATVDKYIAEEVASGRLVESQDPSIHRNPIGMISKPHQPGKFAS